LRRNDFGREAILGTSERCADPERRVLATRFV